MELKITVTIDNIDYVHTNEIKNESTAEEKIKCIDDILFEAKRLMLIKLAQNTMKQEDI